jgi:hypothetical protein
MLKVLFWLLLDGFFGYALFAFWGELGGYVLLLIPTVAFFTWELINSIKNLK